jgi:hypothetical protein
MSPPTGVPTPVNALLGLVAKMTDAELLAMGEEFQRQYVSDDSKALMLDWMKADDTRRDWYVEGSMWIQAFVQQRFGTWGKDDPHRFIRPAVECAFIAAVMDAGGLLTVDVYRDALRGFHAAYVA